MINQHLINSLNSKKNIYHNFKEYYMNEENNKTTKTVFFLIEVSVPN